MVLEVKEGKRGNIIIYSLIGRLDSSSSPTIETKILDAIEGGAMHIILDFGQVDYISSSGIRVLVHCHKELEKKQGNILLASVPKPIENVLYITGFLPYFKMYEGQDQALAALQQKAM